MEVARESARCARVYLAFQSYCRLCRTGVSRVFFLYYIKFYTFLLTENNFLIYYTKKQEQLKYATRDYTKLTSTRVRGERPDKEGK